MQSVSWRISRWFAHVRLGARHRDIGHHIAKLAWANYRIRLQPSPDPAVTRARRAWRAIPLASTRTARDRRARPVGAGIRRRPA
jgi:hypothetical protein